MILAIETGRRLWKHVRGSRGLADRVRDDMIAPIRAGLRSGGEAAAERVRRSNGHARLSAPMLVAAGVVGAVGEYFLDPQSGRRRRAVAKDRIAALLRGGSDPALEAKVVGELFRDADAPKDKVSVSVEEGVVYLRGELPTKKAIEGLARSARGVEGVTEVVNLLHRPGEGAPSKANGQGRGDAKGPSGKTRGKSKRQAPARSK